MLSNAIQRVLVKIITFITSRIHWLVTFIVIRFRHQNSLIVERRHVCFLNFVIIYGIHGFNLIFVLFRHRILMYNSKAYKKWKIVFNNYLGIVKRCWYMVLYILQFVILKLVYLIFVFSAIVVESMYTN